MVDCDEVISKESIERELGGLSPLSIAEVHVTPMIDHLAEEALRVVVVFDPSVSVEDFTGEEILRITTAIHGLARRELGEAYRFPYTRFLTYDDWQLDLAGDLDDDPGM